MVSLNDIKQNTIDWITPEIAIGDWGVQYSDLWKDPFTLLIDVADDLPPRVPCFYYPLGYDKINWKDLDRLNFVINRWLYKQYSNPGEKGFRKVIVHCMAGYERSPLVVATFLAKDPKEIRWMDKAYEDIRKRRDVADCRSWIVY